jgi:hypothetical protein
MNCQIPSSPLPRALKAYRMNDEGRRRRRYEKAQAGS